MSSGRIPAVEGGIQPTIFDAKADILTATAADTPARLAVGSNNQVLTADSSTATGLKWATPAGSQSTWTLLNSGGTNLTGATTVTVSGISGVDKVMVFVEEASSANAGATISVRFNSDTASNYYPFGGYDESTANEYNQVGLFGGAQDRFTLGRMETDPSGKVNGAAFVQNAAATSGVKIVNFMGASGNFAGGNAQRNYFGWGYYNSTSTISSISIVSNTGNLDGGKVYVYTSVN